MTVSGMRPDEVRALAGRLRSAAVRLRGIQSGVDGRVARSSWVGPQATRFRTEVWPRHRAALVVTAQGLERLAADAERQAADQERTSGTAGDGRGIGGSSTASSAPQNVPWGAIAHGAGVVWAVATTTVNLLGVPGQYADPHRYNPVTWAGYLRRLVTAPEVAQVPGLSWTLRKTAPLAVAASNFPLTDLRANPVVTVLRSDAVKPFMEVLDTPVAKGLGTFVGLAGVTEEAYKTGDALANHHYGEAALGAVDTGAAALKMSKNPIAFAAGVGLDLTTDVIQNGTDMKKWKQWKPWTLL